MGLVLLGSDFGAGSKARRGVGPDFRPCNVGFTVDLHDMYIGKSLTFSTWFSLVSWAFLAFRCWKVRAAHPELVDEQVCLGYRMLLAGLLGARHRFKLEH